MSQESCSDLSSQSNVGESNKTGKRGRPRQPALKRDHHLTLLNEGAKQRYLTKLETNYKVPSTLDEMKRKLEIERKKVEILTRCIAAAEGKTDSTNAKPTSAAKEHCNATRQNRRVILIQRQIFQ